MCFSHLKKKLAETQSSLLSLDLSDPSRADWEFASTSILDMVK